MKTKLPADYYAEPDGFSLDRRKRRRQHRVKARTILRNGGGGTFQAVAWWHRKQARYV